MEHRLQEIKRSSCVIMPTYTLQGFVVFLSCKNEVTVLFLDVWVPSKLDREAISRCLQLPFSFYGFPKREAILFLLGHLCTFSHFQQL